jgi:hypothetical protein
MEVRMRGLITAAILVAVGLAGGGGCANSQPRLAGPPPYFVPTAAIVQMPDYDSRAQPDQILPGSDGDYFIARGQRTALGNTSLGEYSVYSVYTYDAQAISVPGSGTGYRYRWILQQGYSGPSQ